MVNQGWRCAADLDHGGKVKLSDGTYGTIERVEIIHLDTPVIVYNFEVENMHTYYVGEQSVLVHNDCSKAADAADDAVDDIIGSADDVVDDVIANKQLTNQTNKVNNYESATKGYDAAKADFDALNPSNVRTYSNGTIAGDLPNGTTVNLHPSSSLGGTPTVEVFDPTTGLSTKIRY